MTQSAEITIKDQSSSTAILTVNDLPPIKLPVCNATLGPNVLDVTQLAKLGTFTYDPGFLSTAACSSKITFIDGEKGILLYRGYPIDQLAEKSDFIEVAYLLLNGELPNTPFLLWVSQRCPSYGNYVGCCRGFIGFLS